MIILHSVKYSLDLFFATVIVKLEGMFSIDVGIFTILEIRVEFSSTSI